MYGRDIYLSDTMGFHSNAAVAIMTGQTPLSCNYYGTMVTIGTNCSYQIPIKTKPTKMYVMKTCFLLGNMICRHIIQ